MITARERPVWFPRRSPFSHRFRRRLCSPQAAIALLTVVGAEEGDRARTEVKARSPSWHMCGLGFSRMSHFVCSFSKIALPPPPHLCPFVGEFKGVVTVGGGFVQGAVHSVKCVVSP